MTSHHVSVGVAGVGGHVLDSHVIPGAQFGIDVVGVYDPSPIGIERLKEVTTFRPEVYTTFDALISSPIDALLITSRDDVHAAQLLAAVKAGVRVIMCDKPLAVNRQDLQLVREAFKIAQRGRQVILSCHPRRETPNLPYGWARENLTRLVRDFGALMHVELDFSYPSPTAGWKKDRSLLLDHFPHEIDFLVWLIGNKELSANRYVDLYDRYVVTGMLGVVTFTCIGTRRLGRKTYPEIITLRFERGTCTINTKTGAVIRYDHESQAQTALAISPTDYEARSHIIAKDLIAAVRSGYTVERAKRAEELLHIAASSVVLASEGQYTSKH
ncbi:MAG TPA: Gfo/Idh/MocA family oxidoreductase [Candidatus Saccharimonadales bacterium]|nr:Gfo/Idh/MocA family oxidoreductase [Candidatus Saccharimonadales bacterium]